MTGRDIHAGDNVRTVRLRDGMVRAQIEARGVADPALLRALRTVPRHLFVPESEQAFAYEDRPLPIGSEQTISQPYIVAFMTEAIAPAPHHRVLEVGGGCGYQAAVLSLLVREVDTIELVEDLGVATAERLRVLGFDNVRVRVGDGSLGWEELAPFDAILVACGAADVPARLVSQLVRGGRMIVPVGPAAEVQELVLVQKDASGRVLESSLMPVRFVPLRAGTSRPTGCQGPGEAPARDALG